MQAIPALALGVGASLLSKPKASQATSKPIDMSPAEFRGLRNPFAGSLAALTGAAGTGIPNVALTSQPGPTASMSDLERLVMGGVVGQAFDPTRQGVINQTLGGEFLPGQSGGNPFLRAAIEAAQRPTFEGLEHVLSRTLPGQFAMAGQRPGRSSAFGLAAARLAEAGVRQAGDIASSMSNQAFEAERGRQMQAIALSQEEVQRALQAFQATGVPRAIEETGIERGMTGTSQQMSMWLQAMQLLGGVTAPAIANTAQATGASPGMFASVFPKGVGNLFAPAPGVGIFNTGGAA